ncbi:MAG: CPBP family intramembrane metalloprotease [Bacteroidetes bacterium]|nr:CPBP family intramembrane metalloprotease [Bacteroidota bacterium]
MQYRSAKGFTGWGQTGILLVFVGLGLILAAVTQFIIAYQVIPSGIPMDKMGDVMMKSLMDPKNVSYARLAQVVGTLCLLFIPAVGYSLITNGKSSFWLGFNKYINAQQVLIGFGIIFFANMLAAPLEDISKMIIAHLPRLDAMAKELEKAYNDQVVALSNLKSWPEYIMAIFIMAFFPALFEEVFFRGTVQNLLVKWWRMPLLGILVTSLVFSLIHMSAYLFLSRAVLGFALGLLYFKTKNIWVNVIAHFLNNAIAVTQLFIMSRQQTSISPDKLDPKVPWWTGIIAILVLYLLFRALDKHSAANREKIMAKEQLLLADENVYNPFAHSENG